MHKCGICEERGSGYDKIVYATSKNYMIAPKVENLSDKFTRVTLYSKMPFELTTKESRIRTCYMLSCLAYINGKTINNSDIRELFALDKNENYKSSRIIKDTVEAGLIKSLDDNKAPRYMKYVPFWS